MLRPNKSAAGKSLEKETFKHILKIHKLNGTKKAQKCSFSKLIINLLLLIEKKIFEEYINYL
jgi:hypothetical protein